MASLLALYWHPRQTEPTVNGLAPCPNTPNCVSTEAERTSQQVRTVAFADAPGVAQARAKAALLAEPRSKIVSERAGALHGECRSMIFRFVDDVDIIVDSASHVFRFRSASRVGRSDLGVNRKRIDRIAARLRVAGG
jgi:uncharacterized protein (DUF1499 family)